MSLRPRTKKIHLLNGDDYSRWLELWEAFQQATLIDSDETQPLRLGQKPVDPAKEAALAHDEFVEEANKRSPVAEIQSIGGFAYEDLIEEHPPREGNQVDAGHGYNTKTFPRALAVASLVSVTGETLPDDAAKLAFLGSLSTGAWRILSQEVINLNTQVADPKPGAQRVIDSLRNQSDDEPSELPDRLG